MTVVSPALLRYFVIEVNVSRKHNLFCFLKTFLVVPLYTVAHRRDEISTSKWTPSPRVRKGLLPDLSSRERGVDKNSSGTIQETPYPGYW